MSEPSLNGRAVKLLQFDAAAGRWLVRLGAVAGSEERVVRARELNMAKAVAEGSAPAASERPPSAADWDRFPSRAWRGYRSLLWVLRNTDAGLVSKCDDLTRSVRAFLADVSDEDIAESSSMFNESFVAGALGLAASERYHIFLVDICAARHEFVIETVKGRARIFQAAVDSGMEGPVSSSGGFAAIEWARAEPPPRGWPTESLARAHKRWGGGRELSIAELRHHAGLDGWSGEGNQGDFALTLLSTSAAGGCGCAARRAPRA